MNTLIISGGQTEKQFVKKIISENKFKNIIAVDKGLEILNKLEILPTHIIGDFDSVDKKILTLHKNDAKIQILDIDKDYTDTYMSLELAIEIGSTEITMLGATGTRLDHMLANIHDINMCLQKGIECKIINENNEIFLINKTTNIKQDLNYKYISLLPLTTEVTGITLHGFKYPYNNGTLYIGKSRAISNEQIEENATIELKEGILIVIKSKD